MRFYIAIILLLMGDVVQATSLVYNMRVRRAFANLGSVIGKEGKGLGVITGVPIAQHRTRNLITNQFHLFENNIIGGSLINVRYLSPKSMWWAEVTTGLEHEHTKFTGTSKFSIARTGFDDMVFAGGCNAYWGKKLQGVVYGITGIPTRLRLNSLEGNNTLVGTRFFSLGAGTELSYAPIRGLKRSLIFIVQNRFLHFFKRNWRPIIDGKIRPGNLIDLLGTIRFRQMANLIETGYNATFFTNQALIIADQESKLGNFVRHSFYSTFTHFFRSLPVITKPGGIGVGFSGGFSKKFSTRILTGWVFLTAVF